jgi:hypothetical protein
MDTIGSGTIRKSMYALTGTKPGIPARFSGASAKIILFYIMIPFFILNLIERFFRNKKY